MNRGRQGAGAGETRRGFIKKTAADAATAVPGQTYAVDTAVLSIARTYDPNGAVASVTSYDAASSGNTVNQLKYTHDAWGAITHTIQDPNGPAGDTDPNVAYTWGYGLTGNAATYSRLEKVTLPGGRQVYYNYEDANQFMSLGRVGDIADGNSGGRTKYVAYKYLGASMVVDADHPAVPTGLPEGPPSGRLTLDPNADKTYWGYDSVGRVIDQKWARSAGSAADRFAYTYDRGSNRLTRSQALKADYNETYQYDALDRLKQAGRAGDANSLYAQAAKLLASDGAAGDNLGSCVALDGDLAIVGAPSADPNSVSNSGAAYVFHKGDDGWRQVAKLVDNDPNADDNFGKAVAISGQTVLVGSPNADPNGSNSGAAYVFNCTSGAGWQWQQAAKLVASDGAASNYFGNAVAIDGSRIVIGAHGRDSSKGAAYVFEHSDANGWQEKCKLPSGTLNASDYFGFSVSLDGNTAVSGAYGDDQAADAGAAYVFRYSGTSWSLEQKLTAGDAAASDAFGRSVAISGDKVVVSAPMDDYDSKSNVGSAYVFSRSGSTWSQQKQLKASDGAAGDWFGGMAPPISPAAVSIDGNTVWVGAPGRDDNGSGSGSAYAFGDPNLGQKAKLLATDGAAGDYMGNSVCVRGNTAIVGAYGDDDAGAAYVFRDANTALSQSWSLDPRGNWTSSTTNDATQTRTHDNANQILTISGVALAPLYDQAGNNVRGPRPADPNANNAAHFRYDAWNRLSTIHLDDGSTSGTLDANDTLLATYRYDGLNRRVKKAVDVDGNSVTDYMYHNENWQIVEVRRGVNAAPTTSPYKQFVYDIRYIDSPVCRWWDKDSDGTMEPAAGEMQYFTNDGNFNTTALVDANSGGVVERYLYDPYGKVTVLNGAAGAEKDPNVAEWSPDADNKSDWDNEILYCGYWYDPETGLYHVRERYYDPITGTWKTRDRILYPDGMNLYQYVGSKTTSSVDPFGLYKEEWKSCFTDGQKKKIGAVFARVKTRADALAKEADVLLKQLDGPASYFELRQMVEQFKTLMENMRDGIDSAEVLELYQYDFVNNPEAGAKTYQWIWCDKELHFNTTYESGSWDTLQDVVLNELTAHELSHLSGTKDNNKNPFMDSHKIDDFFGNDITLGKWAEYLLRKQEADRKHAEVLKSIEEETERIRSRGGSTSGSYPIPRPWYAQGHPPMQ
jgi:RHS repeat-associated protein